MRLADRLERIMRFDNSAARTARVSTMSPPPSPPGRGAPPSPSRHMPRTVRRTYDAAAMTRLTYNWPVLNLSSDAEIRANLKPLRARSRDLAINNDYGRKFIGMVIANVIGPAGIGLKMNIKDPASATPDTAANALITEAWRTWGKLGNCDVTGQLSWRDAQRLCIQSIARDGEVLIRKVRGFDNPSGFALQFIEADQLDDTYNYMAGNGNEIRMGVELDRWKRPVAYHLLAEHPGDFQFQLPAQRYEIVPASDILHIYIKDRALQTRGVPWMHSAMTRMNNLGGYEEAEITAARVSASKMGVVTHPPGEDGLGLPVDADDPEGDVIEEVEPGMVMKLPQGYDWKEFDPTHPAGNFAPFMKATLRGIASGLLVSYNSLASDLEGVNYSSIRAGLLEERDMWRIIQGFVVDHFCTKVFEAWLAWCLLNQTITLPFSKFDKFNKPAWRPRGWAWVDPLKDQKANTDAVAGGFDSRTNIIAQDEGRDIEEVFDELAAEQALAKKKGLTLTLTSQKSAPAETDESAATGGSEE